MASTDLEISISVVICAYTEARWDDLRAGIASIQDQDGLEAEIVVVIDHNDALLERFRAEIGDVTVVPNTGRRGLSDARNTGMAAAHGDVVAFLDDDAKVAPGWLAELTETYRDPGVLGVGGSVEPNWDGRRPRWFAPEFDWTVGCSYVGLPETTAPIRNFIGTNMSFRREPLLESGGFSAELGRVGADAAGCEETELCIRMVRQTGERLIYEPAAHVLHRVPTSRGTLRYFTRRCYQEGRSKATVTRLVGQTAALESERAYLRSVIPRRILGCVDPRNREAGSLAMAAAVLLGVAATVLGYVLATVAPRTERSRVRPGSARGWLGLGVVFTLWGSTFLWSIQINHMGDYGLPPILPLVYYAALSLLTLSFWYWVRWRRASSLLLAAHVVVLLVILHATPAILEQTVRYAWSYKHIGITDYILRYHGVNGSLPNLTVYQDWPGFFGLNALFISGAGLHSALSYAVWAPLANELLCLAPLVLIYRTFTSNRSVIWTGVWIFYLGNWIGQDYFSPQAFAFFLYLVTIALVLRWFVTLPPTRRQVRAARALGLEQPASIPLGRWSLDQQGSHWGMVGAVATLTAAIAMTHQLTPFMLVIGLAGLLVLRQLRSWKLFALVAVISAGWVFIWALPFLHQQLPSLIQSLGHPFDATKTKVAVAGTPSAADLSTTRADELLSGAIGLLALVGIWQALHSARWRRLLPALILAVTPALALLVTHYGNEVVFRIYLFSLPFLALFAAFVLAPRPTGTDLSRAVRWSLGLLALLGLTAAFLIAYDGKESTNYIPACEVAALHQLSTIAPSGSLITGPTGDIPWALDHYEFYNYEWFLGDTARNNKAFAADPVASLFDLMSTYPHAYLVFSPTDANYIEFNGVLPAGQYRRLQRDVLASPEFTTILKNSCVTVVTLRVTQ